MEVKIMKLRTDSKNCFDCLAIFPNVFDTILEVLTKKVSIVSQSIRMFLIPFWRYSHSF